MTTSADWTGRVGDVWAEEWRRTERAVADLEPQLEDAILAVAPAGGRFLDIGCGVGTTALAVARARPAASFVGADLSAGIIALARERAADLPNIRFHCGDVLGEPAVFSHPGLEPGSRFSPRAALDDAAPYDLLFSRHGVMFFPDPVAAFRRLHAAASPGAPLVFTCFAALADNPWATLVTDAPARSASYVPGPFAFADPQGGHDLLVAAGWREPHARHVPFRYRAGEGDDPVADAVAFFRRIGPAASALRDADAAARMALLARLAERIGAYRTGNVVDFPAAAWLWSARA